uniref:Protein NRT1/ PTR family 5.10 n=1 Tax=Vitis vinifera TaxID=29760 RepID=A5CBH5_VITVI|nr:hypothetical protein VITISV_000974 [Vitis vinifera]
MRKYPSGCVLWLELPEAPDLRCWKTQSMAPSITRAVQPRDPLPAVGDPHISSWSNLINFFTDRLGQSNPTAGESVNIWTGTGSLMPLVGAFVADSYLGRYATIINASLLYILALLAQDGSKGNGRQCTIDDVEEAKAVLRLFPIGATCLAYAIVYAQSSTFFTKQGFTMDRSIGSGFDIPAASLQAFIGLSIVLTIPIYDRIFVPIARTLTRKPSGITMLQRIGTGMFLSAISMVIAARTWLG